MSSLESSVLVLNSGYAAVRITNARRAFILLIRDAAEVVTTEAGRFQTYDLASWIVLSELVWTSAQAAPQPQAVDPPDWVRTPRLVLAVPRVIRLLGYGGRPRRDVRLTRRNIHARDRSRCYYCGQRVPTAEITIDHVVPRSLGGRDTWDNLVTACVPLQLAQGRPHAADGQHEPAAPADQAAVQPDDRPAPAEPQVRSVAGVRGRVLDPPQRRLTS